MVPPRLSWSAAPGRRVVGAILLLHAWAIAELYANRGAKVVKPRARAAEAAEAWRWASSATWWATRRATLHARTGLVMERGALGVWLVGEAGALLVRGRRVHCWCVRVPDADAAFSDRIAHLLLALREDEEGFATVANHAFAGARWRVRRRLPKSQRPALAAAATAGPSTQWIATPVNFIGRANGEVRRFGQAPCWV